MSNHLLLEVIDFSTSRIMQSLLTGYARRFNATHKHRGHLFQGRYKGIVCDRESYLLELVRYIHLNPVRAGLVKRPIEWSWSGHGEYLGRDKRKTDRSRSGDGGATSAKSLRGVCTGGHQGLVPSGMASRGLRAVFGFGKIHQNNC